MSKKLESFQKKYHRFIYKSYNYYYTKSYLKIEYKFEIENLCEFSPRWEFKCSKKLSKDLLDVLVFNLGMAELISYWKATCSPIVEIKCGNLSSNQIKWWEKLYKFGLGEFYYQNKLDIDDFSMDIKSYNKRKTQKYKKQNYKNILVPVGGGKDSIVTLEVLKKYKKNIVPYLIGDRKAGIETAKEEFKKYSKAKRVISKELLLLNRKGFLNGHTPFSAIVAFSSLIQAEIDRCKYIVLSNESSANEETVITKKGNKINHQYSKSYEFESDFREYCKKYLRTGAEYFSLLRPLNELQIANIFCTKISQKYFSIFKSCNVGLKDNKWCLNCPKCLFVYIMLSPFLTEEELKNIFSENLLKKKALIPIRKKLQGITNSKPFECVGTTNEVNIALKSYNNSFNKELNKTLREFNNENFVPKKFLNELNTFINQKILIWGTGLEGNSSKKFLENAGFEVTMTGDNNFVKKNYKKYSKIYKSPGISLNQLGLSKNKEFIEKVTSETNEFLRIYKNQTIGITGSKGKSTTSSLLYKIFDDAKKDVVLLGNIGTPPFSLVKKITPSTIIIFEVSSHQLEYVKYSPHIAVLLNLYQDHLTFHGSVKNYRNAKLNIKKFQNKYDIFFNSAPILNWHKTIKRNILGEHNLKNIAFCWQVAKIYNIKKSSFIDSVSKFMPLEHRMELVPNKKGITVYNDSISTIPESSIEALKTLKNYKNIFLIVGGFDRKIDYSKFQKFLNVHKNIKTIVLPNAGTRISKGLKSFTPAENLRKAVKIIAKKVQKTDAVVLSPAASSFDFFKDYKDRGAKFKKYIKDTFL